MDRLVNTDKVAGMKQTKNAIISGKAAVVYIAADIDPAMFDMLSALCVEYGTEVVAGHTRKEIAKACRVDVPCAAAAVLK